MFDIFLKYLISLRSPPKTPSKSLLDISSQLKPAPASSGQLQPTPCGKWQN
jgi:hypothetical protein